MTAPSRANSQDRTATRLAKGGDARLAGSWALAGGNRTHRRSPQALATDPEQQVPASSTGHCTSTAAGHQGDEYHELGELVEGPGRPGERRLPAKRAAWGRVWFRGQPVLAASWLIGRFRATGIRARLVQGNCCQLALGRPIWQCELTCPARTLRRRRSPPDVTRRYRRAGQAAVALAAKSRRTRTGDLDLCLRSRRLGLVGGAPAPDGDEA